ncbi:MAG: hypothetical protein U1F48_06690 [Burkholderiales bacterium]
MPSKPVNRARRVLVMAAGSLPLLTLANGSARTALPGGGSIVVPGPYQTKTEYPNYADRAPQALVAYRNWASTYRNGIGGSSLSHG